MKTDLTTVGFEELHTPEQVDKAFAKPGTVLCMVNSVCGCAAGAARPEYAANVATTSERILEVMDRVTNLYARQSSVPDAPSRKRR